MMKRLICALLALFLLTAVFTAFAEDSGSTPPGEPPEGFGNGNPPGEPPEGFGNGTPPGEPPEGFEGGNPPGNPPDGFGGGNPPGGSAANVTYTAAAEINEYSAVKTSINETYASDAADESALLLRQAEITIDNPSVSKTGDSDGGDSCSFYGLNAAVLVKDGATAVINGGVIETAANGANAVFCYGGNGGRNGAEGDGTALYINGTVIIPNTSASASRNSPA